MLDPGTEGADLLSASSVGEEAKTGHVILIVTDTKRISDIAALHEDSHIETLSPQDG
jgi:hypothetical protein